MNYIVFDLEATCKENDRSFRNEIIEIGAVKINEKREIVDEFTSFVKPLLNSKLTAFCTRLTTITQTDVDTAVSFKEVLPKFRRWIGAEDYVLCSWGFYDRTQLKKDCELHKLDTAWLKNHVSLKHQYGAKKLGIEKGVGMGGALKKEGLKLIGTHHRGIDDAKNIAQIFLKNFEMWDF